MVSDVELVCVPKFRSAPSGDLFAPAMENLLDEYIAEHRERYHRRLDKNNRVACGTKYKRLEVDGVPLDLFSVLGAAEWGGDLSDPNRAVGVQQAGRLAAVQGRPTAERLRGEGRCGVASCQAGRGNVDQPLPMPEESDFFALLGIDYLPPELRR